MALRADAHSYIELARLWAEESDGGFTTADILGIWEQYPEWAPGGPYYGVYGLPSSRHARTVDLDRELIAVGINWFGLMSVLAMLGSVVAMMWLSLWFVGLL